MKGRQREISLQKEGKLIKDAEIEGCVLQMEKEHKPRNTSQTDAERGKATGPHLLLLENH